MDALFTDFKDRLARRVEFIHHEMDALFTDFKNDIIDKIVFAL